MHDLVTTSPDQQVRQHLLKLSSDLNWLPKAENTPAGTLLIEARSKFNRITAAEPATARFDSTYLVEGVLVKDQPAGLVEPKKSNKTNISIDLAVSLAIGGRFLGYFNVPERPRVAVMSGESGMATIQETTQRICKAASVNLADTDIIFSDTPPKPWQFLPAHAHHLRALNCPLDACDHSLQQAHHSVTLVVRGNPQNVCKRPVVGNADVPLGETERVAE